MHDKRSAQRPPNGCLESTDPRLPQFVAAYERTHKVSAAMRAAGLSSRSTAYRWLGWYQEAGLNSPPPRTRARKTGRIPTAVRDEIIDLRHESPSWGRRRIANELAQRHGHQVVSPASVERILTESRLWSVNQRASLTGWTEPARLDTDQLLAACQRGIQLDIHDRALETVSVLQEAVWNRIGLDHDRRTALLREPMLGSWLLRSLVHLGHALIVTGRWFPALGYLEAARYWLQTLPTDRRQVAFEEGAQWVSNGPETPWIPMALGARDPRARPWVSLRRDDIWIECCQYLGVVLRDDPAWRGVEALRQGLETFHPRSRRQINPRYPANARGTLEHDLGRLMLRMGTFPPDQIEHHLGEAEEQMYIAQTQGAAGHGMLATIAISRSRLYRRLSAAYPVSSAGWAHELEQMAAQAMSAVAHAERDSSPVIGVTVVVDTVSLLLGAGMVNEIDHGRLHRAAETCATNGYVGQARELLSVPGIERHLTDESLVRLSDLIAETRRA